MNESWRFFGAKICQGGPGGPTKVQNFSGEQNWAQISLSALTDADGDRSCDRVFFIILSVPWGLSQSFTPRRECSLYAFKILYNLPAFMPSETFLFRIRAGVAAVFVVLCKNCTISCYANLEVTSAVSCKVNSEKRFKYTP